MTSLIILLIAAIITNVIIEHKKYSAGNFVDVIVLDDHSQPKTVCPEVDTFIPLYRYELDLEQRAMFRYNIITETEITFPVEASICNWKDSIAQNTEKKLDFRFKQIEGFFTQIGTIVARRQGSSKRAAGLPHSEVFRTIAAEYNVFGSATEKKFIIYSGLFERSDLFDSSSEVDMALLHSNTKAIAKRFRKAYKIRKADSVDMTFVYEPTDKADCQRFLQMVGVFQLVFKRKGANITITLYEKPDAI